MDLNIERRQLEPERVLSIELMTTADEYEMDLAVAFRRLSEALSEADALFTGPGVCIHPDNDDYSGKITIIAGIPFEGEVETEPDMKIIELPGGSALVGTLYGPYEHLPQAWIEMNDSCSENGNGRKRARRAPFDRFIRSMVNVVSPDELITELVIPLA